MASTARRVAPEALALDRPAPPPIDLAQVVLVGIAVLLTAAPLMRIEVGEMPVNFIDLFVLTGLALIWGGVVKRAKLRIDAPIPVLILAYFLFVLGGWLREVFDYQIALEPLYVLFRHTFAILAAVLLPTLVRTRRDLELVVKAVLVGVAFSSVFAIVYAMPPFGAVRVFLNAGSFLFPGRARAKLDVLSGDVLDRAMSPVGDPNVTACWFALFFPLALMVWRTKPFGNKWSVFAMLVTFSTLGGALVTYGRSTFIALTLICAAVVGFRLFRAWLTVTGIALLTLTFIVTVGVASSYFDFGFVLFKFERMLADPTAAYTDRARLASYTSLFPFLEKNPIWLVTGMGVLSRRGVRLGVIELDELILNLENGEIHSMFAASFYHYGLIAMVVFTLIYVWAFARCARMALRRDSPFRAYWQYLFVAWVGVIPYWMFTHMYVTSEQGVFLFFFLIGLVFAVSHLDPTFRSRRLLRRRYVYRAYGPDGPAAHLGTRPSA